MEDYFYIF